MRGEYVKGIFYISHDSRSCWLGGHSNRGRVKDMCPVYLALRQSRLRAQMRWARYFGLEGKRVNA
jgi:ribosome modulation factor